MAEHQGTDATLSWPKHDPLVGIHQAGWVRFPANIGWGHCVTLSFTRWKGATGIALPIGYPDLSSNILVVFLRSSRPPIWSDHVPEHLVYCHPGDGQAEREYILITRSTLGG